MTDFLPDGALIEVRMTVRLSVGATHEEIAEWLAVELAGWPSELANSNLLRDEPVMAFAPDDIRWSDTGQDGRVVEGAGPLNQPWPDLYVREPRR